MLSTRSHTQLSASHSVGEVPPSIPTPSNPDDVHRIRELAEGAFTAGDSSAYAKTATPVMTAAARTDFDCPSNPYYRCFTWFLFINYIEDAIINDFCTKAKSTDHDLFRQYLTLLKKVTPTYDSIKVCLVVCCLSLLTFAFYWFYRI